MSTRETQIIEGLRKNFNLNLEGLVQSIKKYLPDFDEEKFKHAFAFAALAHNGQMRKDNCTPYILHPFEAAQILASLHADETTLIAALLHDVPEDTNRTISEIEEKFGKKVAYLVEGITKLSKVHYRNDMKERQIESLKKLFIHVAHDPRTILIKLADRLHNMRTLHFIEPEKRIRIAKETLEIFVPIANLLGIDELKTELEDICFRVLYPEEFTVLSEKISEIKEKNRYHLEETIKRVETELRENKIEACLFSNQKNFYSVYKTLQSQQKNSQDLEDFTSIRILVREKSECYLTLGIIHNLFKPKLNRFKDYIANPKINGYQSLHTSVFGIAGLHTKFQIMTNEMHQEAQYGIASHYFSKAGEQKKAFEKDKRAHWVEGVIKMQKDEAISDHFLNELKYDIFQERIVVFTPIGDRINLPENATCIDFAYNIHTEVGNRAVKAEVNDQNVPLNYALKSGDTIKIITTDHTKAPSYEWLSFAKTALARNKMKEFFRKEERPFKIKLGRKLLQKEYDRVGLGLVTTFNKWRLLEFAKTFPVLQIKSLDDILVYISEGAVSPLDFINILFKNSKLVKSELHKPKQKFNFGRNPATKMTIKIQCSLETDLAKIIVTMQELGIIIIAGNSRLSFFGKSLVYKSVLLIKSYAQLSKLFELLEQIEGVKKVERTFWQKKLYFMLGSIATFLVWAMHPYLLLYLSHEWGVENTKNVLISNVIMYVGLFLLFFLIFSLKGLTQRSFPELRETRKLWLIGYILSFFALMTICGEIYILKLEFNWAIVLGLVILMFGYLTSQHLKYKEIVMD